MENYVENKLRDRNNHKKSTTSSSCKESVLQKLAEV
jgi:hypothetical protein